MIAIGCDHAGYPLKLEIIEYLKENNLKYKDLGCDGSSCDYPVIATRVCREIISGNCDRGILICGTGIGMSIAANKHKGIRAALCSDYFSAKYTRLHNDSNVICLGARTIGTGLAIEIVNIYLNSEFEGGRHKKRIDMFMDIENNNL